MANFGRVKTWGNEILQPTDLNAEFDNIINNVTNNGINSANIDETDNYSWSGTSAFSGAVTLTSTLTVGVDDTGHDVKFFGATSGSYWLWDESADGVVQIGTLTVGVDDTGHDVKFFGATTGKSWLWDESADTMIVTGAATVSETLGVTGNFAVNTNKFAVTAASGNTTVAGTLGVTGALTATAGITSGANIVSDTDSTDDLGTTAVRWANLYVDDITATTSAVIGTTTISTGSITDSSTAISFGDENLSTTGTLGAGATTVTTLDLTSGATTASQVHIGEAANEGGYILSSTDDQLILFGGCEYLGGTWYARSTQASGVWMNAGAAEIYTDASLTDGNPYTPTVRLTIATDGAATFSGTVAGAFNGTLGATTPAAATVTTLNTSGAVTFNDAGADVDFRVEGVGAANALFVQGSDGAVGIGTAAPGDYLTNYNNLVIANTAGASGISLVANTANDSRILFADGTSGDARNAGQIIYSHASDYFAFHTAISERMRLDASGNLGVGVTPLAGLSTYKLFQIGSNNVIQSYPSSAGVGSTLRIFNNAVLAADGSTDYISQDEAGQYVMVNGTHAWYTAPADGAAGTNVTFGTAKLTIANDGKVGIGGTPSYPLDVACSIAGYGLRIRNQGDDATFGGIQIVAGKTDGSGNTKYLDCFDDDGGPVGYIWNTSGTFQLVDVSDATLKENITPTEIKGIDNLRQINVVDFDRKKSGCRVHGGFTAQDLLPLYPQAVAQPMNEDGTPGKMGVAKAELIGPIIKSVQELDGTMQTFMQRDLEREQQIDKSVLDWKAEAKKLEARVAELEAKLAA